MTNDDLTYWEEVLDGEREPDPAGGMDLTDLALCLIEQVRIARRVAKECYHPHNYIPVDMKTGTLLHEVYDWLVK